VETFSVYPVPTSSHFFVKFKVAPDNPELWVADANGEYDSS